MRTKISLLFLILLGLTTHAFSQVTTPADTAKKDTSKITKLVKTIINDTTQRKESRKDTLLEKKLEKKFYSPRQFVHETFLYVETPFHWRSTDWIRVGITLATVAAIMPFDQRITNSTQGDQHFYSSVPIIAGYEYGEWYSIGAVTAAFATYGILAHDTAAKKIAIELFQSGVYAEAFTEVLKVGIGRARPYENLGPFNFHPFNLNNNFESMPSGHSTAAFALSTVMFRHAHKAVWKILAFAPAALTMFSRLYQDFHWTSDCIMGAASGFSTGMWVVNLHERKLHKINIPPDNKK